MVVLSTLRNTYNDVRYIPTVKPTIGEVKQFYSWKHQGFDVDDNEVRAAIMEELHELSDYCFLKDEDLDAIRSSLATSVKDAQGKSTQSHKLPVRTLRRMKVFAKAATYLSRVQRDITTNEMNWHHLLPFQVEYEALEKSAAAPPPEVPKYSKNKGWLVHMHDMMKFFSRVYGCQLAPLAYLIISDDLRDETSPGDADYKEFLAGKFYSEAHPRIVEELLARASRTTADAEADAELLYNYLGASLTGTAAESLLDDFSKSRDGVGLWQRIKETQLTPGAFEASCEKHLKWLMTNTWSGPQDGPLDAYINKHRRQYEQYLLSAKASGAQQYEGVTRVGWMLNGIKSLDPNIIVRKQTIRDDDAGKRVDFESAAVYLSKCEYEGKNDSRKRKKAMEKEADISSVNGGGGGNDGLGSDSYQKNLNFNGSRGKTGVELRWHSKPQFKRLPEPQRKELLEWRATTGLSAKAQRQAKKAKKAAAAGASNVSNAKARKAISDIASAAAALPDGEHRTKIESILSSVGAEVGSVTLAQSTPTGEDEEPSGDQSNDVVAEVGGSTVVGEDGDKVEDEVKKDVEAQVAAAAALGTQMIVKFKGGGKSEEN